VPLHRCYSAPNLRPPLAPPRPTANTTFHLPASRRHWAYISRRRRSWYSAPCAWTRRRGRALFARPLLAAKQTFISTPRVCTGGMNDAQGGRLTARHAPPSISPTTTGLCNERSRAMAGRHMASPFLHLHATRHHNALVAAARTRTYASVRARRERVTYRALTPPLAACYRFGTSGYSHPATPLPSHTISCSASQLNLRTPPTTSSSGHQSKVRSDGAGSALSSCGSGSTNQRYLTRQDGRVHLHHDFLHYSLCARLAACTPFLPTIIRVSADAAGRRAYRRSPDAGDSTCGLRLSGVSGLLFSGRFDLRFTPPLVATFLPTSTALAGG